MTVQTSPSLRKTASPSAGSCAPAVGAASRPRRRTFATRPSIPSSRAVASALVSRAAASPRRAPASRVRSKRACASWVHARKGRAPIRSCAVAGQRKALLRQRGKLAPRFGLTARFAPHERTGAALEHRGGHASTGLRPSNELIQTALVKVEEECLNLVAQDRLDIGLPLTELDRALRLLLAVGEPAVHDRARRPPHRQVRQVERLAQLAGDLCPRLDLAVGGDHVAVLEESDDAKPVSEQRELAVPRPLPEVQDLVGDREALRRSLRPPEGDPARTEHGGEKPRVAELPCEPDRLLAERDDPLGLGAQ